MPPPMPSRPPRQPASMASSKWRARLQYEVGMPGPYELTELAGPGAAGLLPPSGGRAVGGGAMAGYGRVWGVAGYGRAGGWGVSCADSSMIHRQRVADRTGQDSTAQHSTAQ